MLDGPFVACSTRAGRRSDGQVIGHDCLGHGGVVSGLAKSVRVQKAFPGSPFASFASQDQRGQNRAEQQAGQG